MFKLRAYSDVDREGITDDTKSTSSATLLLGDYSVHWASKKQASISLSIDEVEYIATATYFSQILWMKKTLKRDVVD